MLGAARLTTKNLSPSYSIGLTPSTTNEGAAGGVINITGTIYFNQISVGEIVYWEVVPVSGSITTNDFNQASGTINLGYSSFTEFTFGVLGDSLTEGIESFYVRLRLNNSSGTILAFSNTVTINDTSTNATYVFTQPYSFTNPNEGTSTTFILQTTNVPNGQQLPWIIRPLNTGRPSAADFTIGTLTGLMTINNNQGTLTLSYVNDNTFEGSEAYVLDIQKMDSTTISSPTVNIQDTSDGGASLKVRPDAYGYGEFLKLALPFRQSTQFNDISYTYYESTQNVAATRTGPTGVVISSSGQKFYDGAFIADGTQTPAQYITTTALNTSGNFCIMFWAKTSSANWNNWVLGNNAAGYVGEMGISLSTYNFPASPNGDTIRLIGSTTQQTLTMTAGGGAEGRIGGLSPNTWYHFCFSKTGWWVNGQYKGTASWAGGSWNLRGGIVIGGAYNVSGGYAGGLQDFRIYVGNNVINDYANFTPPTQMMST